MEWPKPYEGDVYQAKQVPNVAKALRDAIARLEKSKILRAALGDDVIDHYLHAGRWEQQEYDRRFTDWEVTRGFEQA